MHGIEEAQALLLYLLKYTHALAEEVHIATRAGLEHQL